MARRYTRRTDPRAARDAYVERDERESGIYWYDVLWHMLRPAFVGVVSMCIVAGIVITGWNLVNTKFLVPVDIADTQTVPFTVAGGESLSTVARHLEENKLVRNRSVFRYLAEFQGKGGNIQAGSYDLSPSMALTEIIDQLTVGDGKSRERTIKIIPGWTVRDIAAYLKKEGAIKDENEFLNLCKDVARFGDSYQIAQLVENGVPLGNRIYPLEGYLAPDTYRIFKDASAESIVKKLLEQNEVVVDRLFNEYEYAIALQTELDQRGEEDTSDIIEDEPDNTPVERHMKISLSQDEVMTLASMIEKEGKTKDFRKVSAVFHNRLKDGMKLQSCVTVQYVLNTKRLALTDHDTSVESPYNTYANKGLPIGPVCNPSPAAIKAALDPDVTFMDEGYLYFCSRDPKSGELAFAKTLDEHQANVDRYRPLWVEYDKTRGE